MVKPPQQQHHYLEYTSSHLYFLIVFYHFAIALRVDDVAGLASIHAENPVPWSGLFGMTRRSDDFAIYLDNRNVLLQGCYQ